MLGRVIDGLGNPIDGKGPIMSEGEYPIYATSINPMMRKRIYQPLDLGIRVINGLLTVGCGQRVGVFAGSGVGKSVLLGMIARKTRADVNVIALIGERGREVNDFIAKELGQRRIGKIRNCSCHLGPVAADPDARSLYCYRYCRVLPRPG